MLARLRPAVCCAIALFSCLVAHASSGREPRSFPNGLESDLALAERSISASAIHDARFAALDRSTSNDGCQASSQPQALATPDPLLAIRGANSRITVSFIIGTDGRIQSPLILSSDSPSEDRDILRTIRSWRYRPALCNGVPTEAEARVEFSSR